MKNVASWKWEEKWILEWFFGRIKGVMAVFLDYAKREVDTSWMVGFMLKNGGDYSQIWLELKPLTLQPFKLFVIEV